MTGTELGSVAGVVLSTLFEYFPKLSAWYNAQEDNIQRLLLLGAMALVAATIFGMGCAGLADTFACTKEGAWEAVKVFFSGVISSQATYLVLPRKQ
jgi:hypothetical protein